MILLPIYIYCAVSLAWSIVIDIMQFFGSRAKAPRLIQAGSLIGMLWVLGDIILKALVIQ